MNRILRIAFMFRSHLPLLQRLSRLRWLYDAVLLSLRVDDERGKFPFLMHNSLNVIISYIRCVINVRSAVRLLAETSLLLRKKNEICVVFILSVIVVENYIFVHVLSDAESSFYFRLSELLGKKELLLVTHIGVTRNESFIHRVMKVHLQWSRHRRGLAYRFPLVDALCSISIDHIIFFSLCVLNIIFNDLY